MPVSVHAGVPPAHEMTPVSHGLAGGHDPPAVHAPHVPLSQTWPAPQLVPLETLPVALHTETPVEQSVVPVWHGFVGEHTAPDVHDAHDPLSQTWLAPQEVPLATFVDVLPHTGTPVEQPMAPSTHGLGGVPHAAPVEQARQVPLSQTIPEPHEVPLAMVLVVLSHTGEPVEQPMAPTRHWLGAGLQGPPGVHAVHTPARHVSLVPQEVPSVAGWPVSLHCTVPVVQLVWPVWQTFSGVHGKPAAHALQLPTSHTLLVPQLVPSGTLPDDTHVYSPVEQSTTPVLHGLDGEQATPAAHVSHEPR